MEMKRNKEIRTKVPLNESWQFNIGELDEPMKTVRKAAAIGGFTAPLNNENGEAVIIGEGGHHFLNLISGGNEQKGLEMLAGTKLNEELTNEWKLVNIPHDWKNETPFENRPELLMSGSKPDGTAFYRKTFDLEKSLYNEKKITLNFLGVMRMASVWLNGVFLGSNYSGYTHFDFDITELARYGDEGTNVLLVKVDTTTGAEGWWYEGAGIYKDVYLSIHSKVHINKKEVYIETKSIKDNSARLEVHVGIKNDDFQKDEGKVIVVLNNQKYEKYYELPPLSEDKISFDLNVDNIEFWTPDTPKLYNVQIVVEKDDKKIDELIQKFGIRTLKYNEQGFFLNGQLTELRGVCEHQDFGGVGVSLNKDLLRYKLLKMKEMGVNSYRSAHHFASEELLELSDELGIIVMNENRILESSSWRIDDLEKMVKASRNHPSVCFWSLCNEELIGNTSLGNRVAKKLSSVVKNLTDSLIISAELLNPEGLVNEKYLQNFDVIGVNYPEAKVMGEGLKKIKENYPKLRLLATENGSYFSTRGIYQDNLEDAQCSNFGSMFSMILPGKRESGEPGVGGTAHPEEVIAFFEKNAFMGGVFLWTFMDYNGEPSPFSWPGISSQFGITDTVGFEKDYFYYYQSKWSVEPMIHVMPHWNESELEINSEGIVKVRVFSNCPEVELFINDRSQGKKMNTNNYTDWQVSFDPGCLKAVGYIGNQIVEDTRITSGKLTGLEIKERYVGEVYNLYEVNGVDQERNFVPTSDAWVEIDVENGEILGLANGNPADISEHNLRKKQLFSGKLMVIVRKEKEKVPSVNARLSKVN